MLRECVVNLARVKEYVSQNVGGTLDAAGFDNWQDLMRGIQAGLLMLGKSRAVQCIERVTAHLKHVMQPGGSGLAPQALDRLADAIVSIEYYMETLQAGRADPWYMLDNAETALEAVDAAAAARQCRPSTRSSDAPLCAHGAHRLATDAAAPGRSATQVAPVLAPTLQARPKLADAADPELIALFIEEAREERRRSRRILPAWDQDPANEEALVNVAPRIPHAQGQRPRGRCARAGRVRLVDREPAEPPARQDADALASDPRDAARSGAALPQLIEHLDNGACAGQRFREPFRPRPCAGGRAQRRCGPAKSLCRTPGACHRAPVFQDEA